MNNLKETCHCGHDRASHYRDESVRPAVLCACLCTGCECKAFADWNELEPKKKLEKPNHPRWRDGRECQCYRCKQWAAAQIPDAVDTLRGLGDDDFDPDTGI